MPPPHDRGEPCAPHSNTPAGNERALPRPPCLANRESPFTTSLPLAPCASLLQTQPDTSLARLGEHSCTQQPASNATATRSASGSSDQGQLHQKTDRGNSARCSLSPAPGSEPFDTRLKISSLQLSPLLCVFTSCELSELFDYLQVPTDGVPV